MSAPLIKRLEKMPVPILPTMVGAATLANVYAGLGFPWVRHLTLWLAAAIWTAYLCKVITYPKTCAGEYKNVVPASLYAGFTMIMMILGSYVFESSPALGKVIWFIGIAGHAAHILVFTYRNVIKARSTDTFVPSWFVTYNGIMVSCVVGGAMQEPGILSIIVYYGIAVYAVLIPLIIWRLKTKEIKDAMYHTQAIVLAPCSLCVVSYLNVIQSPNTAVVYVLYICVLASLLFIIIKLPRFFSFPFNPGFAGLTFPMAIGIVASTRMAGFLEGTGAVGMADAVKQVSGIQIYLTTAIIGFVLFNFFKMFRGKATGK